MEMKLDNREDTPRPQTEEEVDHPLSIWGGFFCLGRSFVITGTVLQRPPVLSWYGKIQKYTQYCTSIQYTY